MARRTLIQGGSIARHTIPTQILQRGEAPGQRCPLHVGQKYLHATTGMVVTFCGPDMRDAGGWTGRVLIRFADGYKMTVAASRLKEVASA